MHMCTGYQIHISHYCLCSRPAFSASCTFSYRIDGNYVIKVADFALSRDIYSRNYYHGGRGEKVPARWMPVEALVDVLWTEKSDVVTCDCNCWLMIGEHYFHYFCFSIGPLQWAYGVTLWEIFTFGYIPYPGVDVFSIVQYLKDGHRPTKPPVCTQEVYVFSKRDK